MIGRTTRALAVGCLIAAAWVALPLVAAADAPRDTGWWSRENGGNPVGPPVTVPRPPDVPEGGLLVARDLTGESAISALRFRADVETATKLTLTASEGLSALAQPAILACPQASGWGAVDHGLWGTRPDADCDRVKVLGAIDGDTMTWSLPRTFKREERPFVEIILVPAANATPFRTAFDQPDADALTAPVDLVVSTTTTLPPPPPPPTVVTTTTEPPKQFGGPQFVASSPPPTTPPTTTPPTTTPPRSGEVATGPLVPAGAPDSTGERVAAAVLLVLIAAGLWAGSARGALVERLAHVPVVGPRLSGRDAGGETPEKTAGVGRFARQRSPGDVPPRL